MSKKKKYSHIHVMSNLQLVATEGSYLEGILRMVRSPPIIWLRWMGCSESSLPGWIPMENLKVLELHGRMLDFLWPHHSQVAKSVWINVGLSFDLVLDFHLISFNVAKLHI